MGLKELTWENHKSAERKKFAFKLISGKITPEEYYRYLTNQYENYVALEASAYNWLAGTLHGIFRAPSILYDLKELETTYDLEYSPDLIMLSTCDYVSHVYEVSKLDLKEQRRLLLPHMYVRHFGDMYGGAIIKKRVPGSGTMYDFEDLDFLKTTMRQELDDSMAPEANKCFEFAIRLFEDLEK
jgi:heme oxygenase